jgi:hypothetical protein
VAVVVPKVPVDVQLHVEPDRQINKIQMVATLLIVRVHVPEVHHAPMDLRHLYLINEQDSPKMDIHMLEQHIPMCCQIT